MKDHLFAGECLRTYWEAMRSEKGSHAVYRLHGHQLHRVIPSALHLDEGQKIRKSAVLIVHAQTLFGSETWERFEREFAAEDPNHLNEESLRDMMTRAQFH